MNSTKDYYQARLVRLARVRTVAVILMLLLMIGLLYYMYEMRVKVTGILRDAQNTFQTLNTLSTGLGEADIPIIFEDVNTLVGDVTTLVHDGQSVAATATDGLNQAIEKLDQIDIETLNKAITDLANVVEPLAGLFSK